MRVELKDFQRKAVMQLSDVMREMLTNWQKIRMAGATMLAAPTGSGKTVMGAAVIEALFFGNNELGIEADPNATVLWLSDSPSLNKQTLFRLAQASNLLSASVLDTRHLQTVGNRFCAAHESLDRQVVYFLSKDLLGKGKLLTKGGEENAHRTFWDVLDATIQDPARNLYVFIDEAHRGLSAADERESKKDEKRTATIYSQLIDGVDGHLGAPMVVGISATGEKFEANMRTRSRRVWLDSVTVTPKQVQASGLLKDIVELHVPGDNESEVSHQYLDMAARRLVESQRKWDDYCTRQDIPPVTPLMVVQVADNTSEKQLMELAGQLCDIVPGLDRKASFANVFGEHKDLYPSPGLYIPYYEPETIQERSRVRILFAKEAVSNGWDCPRAEVIYSQRHRSQPGYIAQLLGRIVRTPLGRRIEGDDFLNSVACFLPEFNPESTKTVVDYLTGKTKDYAMPVGVSPRLSVTTCTWMGAPTVPGGERGSVFTDEEKEGVVNAFLSLNRVLVEREPANQFTALNNVVSFMALSGFDPQADEETSRKFTVKLNGLIDYYKDEFAHAKRVVESVELHTVTIDRLNDGNVLDESSEAAVDDTGVDHAAKDAARRFTKLLFNEYRRRMCEQEGMEPRDSKIRLAAASRCPSIVQEMNQWAKDLRTRLLDEHQAEYATMSDELRAKAKPLLPMSREARVVSLVPPVCWEPESRFPKYGRHVMYNPATGMAPLKLNALERYVVEKEMGRSRAVAFYRNPAEDSENAVSFPYVLDGVERSVHPDFIFFVRDGSGMIRPAIIDPHGNQFSDTLPKLRGYVEYLRRFPSMYVQALMVADRADSTELRYLDLLDPATQDAILGFSGAYAGELFTGRLGRYYGDTGDC